ncbi:putative uncharacterized protein C3orf49 homolog [Protopterus annectens]|uniref:putative uncharacterized protein C3orf49 homolog n=1 Tax=Protopterus annectens TaxID=7888 RepID=UPI001CF98A6D|nr:putative uncharacterized protein C3orf49 homolog [Protopterus annectens]
MNPVLSIKCKILLPVNHYSISIGSSARWHGAGSINLMGQSVLVPKYESSSESEAEENESKGRKKESTIKKMKNNLGKLVPRYRQHEKLHHFRENLQEKLTANKNLGMTCKHNIILKNVKEMPSPKMFSTKYKPQTHSWDEKVNHGELQETKRDTKRDNKVESKYLSRTEENKILNFNNPPQETATIQLDVDVMEAETKRINGKNVVLRSRRTSRRISVISPPGRLRKVDDLIGTITGTSMRLLAQRHVELQHCEFLGDEILQSSKQFQRISSKSARKFKWKNVCFPCLCC